MARVARGFGWLLISTAAVVLLYVVYSLFYTGEATRRAQQDLSGQFELPLPAQDVAPGDALAKIEFVRPGSTIRPVQSGPLYVVESTDIEVLKRGPGHYAGTAMPGQTGNFAVAGHRTTYANPFFNLQDLRPGDEVHVTDRAGGRYVYAVHSQEIVNPAATRVIGPDPLEHGTPLMTMTTCHPRLSNAQRLIVYAELQRPVEDSTAPAVADRDASQEEGQLAEGASS